jgi:16S rRNA (guanine(966)-N(2))-methyltransferase RsmD
MKGAGIMRVQRGEWHGRKLRSPTSGDIRPMSARLRCKVCDSLAGIFDEATVYDLCAGSGALGIEALSLGAGRATFVDTSRAALELVRENLGRCDAAVLERVELRRAPADRVLEDLAVSGGPGGVLVVFVSPPYKTTVMLCEAACRAFAGLVARRSDPAYLVLQHPPRHQFELPGAPSQPERRTYRAGDSQATVFRFEVDGGE